MHEQTPLNPDALAELAKHVPDLTHAKRAVEIYLAAAQQVVSSVEELDALPSNTIAMFTFPNATRKFPFELSTINGTDRYWMQPGDDAGYKTSIMARYLPARVLWAPEVNTDGR